MSPLTLCSTLFPGLNNECAGLPLVLKATIISLGLTITHAQRLKHGAGEIYWDEFIVSWFISVIKLFECVFFARVCARMCLFSRKK